jgi:K(+)-stimulated pyrophosphate-energized sodium pump
MFNIFLTVFFATLAFACFDPFFFIGYLISLALFGLFQALFLANAGGAWDNAKKVVETELHERARICTRRPSWATPSAIPSRTPRPSR